MLYAYLVAVSVVNPYWRFNARTVREGGAVAWDAAVIRPYWRATTRWVWRVLAALFVF